MSIIFFTKDIWFETENPLPLHIIISSFITILVGKIKSRTLPFGGITEAIERNTKGIIAIANTQSINIDNTINGIHTSNEPTITIIQLLDSFFIR